MTLMCAAHTWILNTCSIMEHTCSRQRGGKKRLMPNSSLKVISRQEGYKTDDKGNFVKAIDNVQPLIITW